VSTVAAPRNVWGARANFKHDVKKNAQGGPGHHARGQRVGLLAGSLAWRSAGVSVK
jgi:hypothetical protein